MQDCWFCMKCMHLKLVITYFLNLDYDEKRKLITNTQMKNKHPNRIIIHCKDLRVFQFSLKFTKEEAAKKVRASLLYFVLSVHTLKPHKSYLFLLVLVQIFQGIVRHSLEPRSLRCIFAFSYCENIAGAPGIECKYRLRR